MESIRSVCVPVVTIPQKQKSIVAPKQASQCCNQVCEYDGVSPPRDLRLIEKCLRNPKLQDVQELLETHPCALQAVNRNGQTAIHVAAEHGVSADVIIYMLRKFPMACSIIDAFGRLPLHYMARSSGWVSKGGGIFEERKENVHPEYVNLIKMTCEACPGALVHEDQDERSPIEYALMEGAPMDVVSILQRTSIEYQRARDSHLLKFSSLDNEINAVASTCA
jgi:hypothetical protein